ncbi:MAG: GNAT family N-acetyltransferase [Candidatus Latescibacterota bacterium]|jgi:predicted N-acetyltransferase YhbS
MSEEIVQLTAADFEDAMDFLNLVFGAHRPHDFERLLPAAYQPTDELMSCNYAIRTEGRIRGIVGMFPLHWQVGDATLKVAGVGGVSTHPRSRGAGYMRALMNHCVRLMREQGYHLSYLGGQRQRYQYFGYERCGQLHHFTLNKPNLRHCFGDEEPGIRFEPLEATDADRLTAVQGQHDAQPIHCLRPPANFYNHLRNWYNRPHVALDADNSMVGYLVATGSGDRVAEMVTDGDEIGLRALRAWVAGHTDHEVTVALPSVRAGLGRLLGRYCERIVVQPSGNWQMFDWPGVLDALLKARPLSGPVLEGEVVVKVEGIGGLKLYVDGGEVGCKSTDDEPAVQCDPLTAMRLFFGPLAPSQIMALPAAAALLDQWCPLPLFWPSQDGV